MESIGQVNRYVCRACGGVHGTINLNTGTTPYSITCTSCAAPAYSSMYNLPHGETSAGWGWYRPLPSVYKTLPEFIQEHILAGGLLLDELEKAIPLTLPEPDEDYDLIMDEQGFPKYIKRVYAPDLKKFARVFKE